MPPARPSRHTPRWAAHPGIRLADALAAGQDNRFGAVRLVLAGLVIVSHAPYLLDGDQHREPLYALTHEINLGELAVLGFFFISGLLVTASRANTRTLARFGQKRAARILPGFAVAFILTLLVAGPLTGGHVSTLLGRPALDALTHLLTLQQPVLDGAFANALDPRMNQSMWTIPYEAGCYALVALLGITVLNSPRTQLWLTTLILLGVLTEPWHSLPPATQPFTEDLRQVMRLLAAFQTGALYFRFRASIVLRAPLAVLAALACTAMLFVPALLFTLGPACGGYALLWLALAGKPGPIGRIGQKTDISYGVYLYGWPIQNSLVCLIPGLTPGLLTFYALPIAALLGQASWHAVERPALHFSRAALSKPQPLYQPEA